MSRILAVIMLLALAVPAAARTQDVAPKDAPAAVEDAPPPIPNGGPQLAQPSPVDPRTLVAATGVVCDIGAVRAVDVSAVKGAQAGQLAAWEVACTKRFGFILAGSANGRLSAPLAYSCPGLVASEATARKLGFNCELKENLDLLPVAQGLADAAGARCTVSAVKWRGWSPRQMMDAYELACAPGQQGWMLVVPRGPAPLSAQTCLQLTNTACQLTTREQTLAWVAQRAAKAGKPCEVFDAGYVGKGRTDGVDYYEVVCQGGDGFVMAVTPDGEFKRMITCEEAAGLGAGCTRSDPQIVFAGLIGKLRATGLDCVVAHARLVGHARDGREVAEFECLDRPQGLMVALPGASGAPVDAVDCLAASHFQSTCQFTSLEAQKALLTRTLRAAGVSCNVSAFAFIGTSGDPPPAQMFEVACSGAPGYIVAISYDYSRVSSRSTCAQVARSRRTDLSCTLPGNR
jgi:hypothetical protein